MATKISRKTTLGEIVSRHPQAAEIMLDKGLHCVGCGIAGFETVEQGAAAHGMTEKEVDEMVKEMNEKIEKKK